MEFDEETREFLGLDNIDNLIGQLDEEAEMDAESDLDEEVETMEEHLDDIAHAGEEEEDKR